jgi:nucleotide-binding universal stress UspA family protein
MPIIGVSTTVQIEAIIFATDFSPASQNAGLYASALSIHFGTDLLVAHAFTLLQASLEVETEYPLSSQQRKGLTHELMLTAESLQAGRGVTQSALVQGDPCKMIPVVAQRRKPALVVMGTHGRGSLDRFVLGSTAEGILRHSSGPALTVGPNVDVLHAGALKVHRILYATDCSAEAAHGAPVAVALAEVFAARIDVLNVVNSNQIDHPDQFHRLQEHFYNALDLVVPQSARKLCEPRTFVSVGNPQSEILKHINDHEIDLLIMGLRRNAHLGMQNRTFGAFPIIVEASCPVITVASGSVYRP